MRKIISLSLFVAMFGFSPAVQADEEMIGTYVNGRMEKRDERSVRVPDPAMDREEAEIDRLKRLQKEAAEDAQIATEQKSDTPVRRW